PHQWLWIPGSPRQSTAPRNDRTPVLDSTDSFRAQQMPATEGPDHTRTHDLRPRSTIDTAAISANDRVGFSHQSAGFSDGFAGRGRTVCVQVLGLVDPPRVGGQYFKGVSVEFFRMRHVRAPIAVAGGSAIGLSATDARWPLPVMEAAYEK